MPLGPRRRLLSALVGLTVAVATELIGASSSAAAPHALITGSGSSWSSNAVSQWIADVHSQGLQVVFSPNGSAAGRQDFANSTVDFAVSDLPYQGVDPATGATDTPRGRAYRYLPIVAGGTALPYHIVDKGQLIRNLRLSGATVAKIFSRTITNWNDPAIKADNNGRVLPTLPIIPVVHSEGSGSTYQFTRYLSTEFPSIWNPFSSIGATEYFPQTTSGAEQEAGSDSVMNFISAGAGNGSIGYDEYSYALGKGYPVAKLLNTGGYYTLPTQYNVAVALTKATVNTDPNADDYLQQNLDGVYANTDTRAYPMSSYSYAIIPSAADDSTATTAKRQTLADYLDYSVCQGQAEMGRVGYSPLPLNLVEAAFAQIQTLKTADPDVDVSQATVQNCESPTFLAADPDRDYLGEIAPKPTACDAAGAGPCDADGQPTPPTPPAPPARHATALSVTHTRTAAYGKHVTLTAVLADRTTHTALGGRRVDASIRTPGTTSYRHLATVYTDCGGRARLLVHALSTAAYAFTYRGDASHSSAIARTPAIATGQALSVHANTHHLRDGHRLVLTGHIAPGHRGSRVLLQRRSRHGWATLATAHQNRGYRISLTPRWRGKATLRVWAAATPTNAGTASAPITIRIT